jgi:hypothetical protein
VVVLIIDQHGVTVNKAERHVPIAIYRGRVLPRHIANQAIQFPARDIFVSYQKAVRVLQHNRLGLTNPGLLENPCTNRDVPAMQVVEKETTEVFGLKTLILVDGKKHRRHGDISERLTIFNLDCALI